jgi:hypothetical protein
MELDFKELHFAAQITRKKVHSRGLQEQVMSQPAHKSAKKLEVQIMFEPSRLQQNYLHQAYAYLVPSPKRRFVTSQTSIEASPQASAPARERKLS